MEPDELPFSNNQGLREQPAYEDLVANIHHLRQTITQMANERTEAANALRTMSEQIRTLQEQQQIPSNTSASNPTLGELGQQPAPTANFTQEPTPTIREFRKPRLPDVEIFDKGSHEEYTQWKTRVRAKLYADREAYPTEDYKVHYIVTRTKGQAFNAIRVYITAVMDGTQRPVLDKLWAQLDRFFEDPTIRQKAFQFLRTTKQGRGEFLVHAQVFDLKFQEAGLTDADDAQKIDYLRNSLNRNLLRYQAGHQPPVNETYDSFVQRMRVTWENLKAIDHLSSGRPSYSSPFPPSATRSGAAMDWTPTVGAVKPRTTREFWGTRAQLAQRKEEGNCLRCGSSEHYARDCEATLPNRTRRPKPHPKVAAMSPPEESSDEGKEEP